MSGLSMGLFIESAVAILMALTLGYCVILNRRLVRLHADREALKLMVSDLISATTLANQAIKELKATAVEADLSLSSRLEEADRFGVELANHINSGTALMQRIARVTDTIAVTRESNKVRAALDQLSAHARNRGVAA
jgi:hypothetical protein